MTGILKKSVKKMKKLCDCGKCKLKEKEMKDLFAKIKEYKKEEVIKYEKL